MSSYTIFTDINQLEEFSFIAGNEYKIYFTAYQGDGITPLNLESSDVYWVLSPYGQPDYRVSKITGEVNPDSLGTNVFLIEVSSLITSSLSGKYIHQPVIVSFSGKEYRPCQGIVLIIPQIPIT